MSASTPTPRWRELLVRCLPHLDSRGLPMAAPLVMEIVDYLTESASSETSTPTFENLQDAPRTLRNVFTVQHEGKRADVVFASFASCIEREANALRHDMERGMANHNADLTASSAIAPTWEPCDKNDPRFLKACFVIYDVRYLGTVRSNGDTYDHFVAPAPEFK